MKVSLILLLTLATMAYASDTEKGQADSSRVDSKEPLEEDLSKLPLRPDFDSEGEGEGKNVYGPEFGAHEEASWVRNDKGAYWAMFINSNGIGVAQQESCQNPRDHKDNLANHFICLDNGSASIDLPSEFDGDHLKLLMHYYAGIYEGEFNPLLADAKVLSEKIGNTIRKDRLNTILGWTNNKTFELIAPYLTKESGVSGIEDYPAAIKRLTEDNSPDKKETLINFISLSGEGHVKEHNGEIITAMKKFPTREFTFNAVHLFSNAEGCASIDREFLKTMSHDQLSNMNHDCLEKVEKIENYPWNVEIRSIPVAVFKKAINLHVSAFQHMTTAQIAGFDSGNESENMTERCKGSNILGPHLVANGAEMAPECFMGAVTGLTAKTAMAEAFFTLPATIFSKMPEGAELTHLEDEWRYISAAQKEHIFKHTDHCENLPVGILSYHADVKISNDCFAKLNAENQAAAIVQAQLEDDVLHKIDADVVKAWKIKVLVEDQDVQGIDVFKYAIAVRNIGAIIEKMSGEISGSHICSLISSMESLKSLPLIQEHGTKECFDAMSVDPDLSDLKDLPARVGELLSMQKIVDMMNNNLTKYGDMVAADLTKLANTTNICTEMNEERLSKLKDEVWKDFPAKCLADLGEIEKISQEKMSQIPPSSFAQMSADQMAKISVSLTDGQLDAAGTGLTDHAKHPASKWTAETVSKMTVTRVANVHASSWNACPADAYAGFTADLFPAVPAANMSGMTAAQLSKVPADVRAKATADQITGVSAAALEAFKDIELSEPAKAAYTQRIAKGAEPAAAEKKV
jgi:hypothetical protein